MWLYSRLKEEQAGRPVRIRSHFHTVSSYWTRHLICTRDYITKEFKRTADTHVTTGTYAENREHPPDNKTCTNTSTHIIFTQCTFFKEFFHQHIVMFGSRFDQCFMKFHRLIHFFRRNFQHFGNTAFRFPTIHLHLQHIDNRIERRTCRNRILDRHHLSAPLFT